MAGNGFNLPIQAISPQLLAEMARSAFKPPALMSGGGGGGGLGSLPQSQGFNVGQGLAGMGQGLGMLAGELGKDRVSGEPETAAVGPGGLSGAVSGIDALKPDANGVWAQPPMPTDIGSGQGGWWARNFGGWLADGGPVEPGQYYTVGERGPETFVPAVPGHIVPGMPLLDPGSAVRPSEMPLYDPYSAVRPSEMPLYDPYSAVRGSERDFFGGRRR